MAKPDIIGSAFTGLLVAGLGYFGYQWYKNAAHANLIASTADTPVIASGNVTPPNIRIVDAGLNAALTNALNVGVAATPLPKPGWDTIDAQPGEVTY